MDALVTAHESVLLRVHRRLAIGGMSDPAGKVAVVMAIGVETRRPRCVSRVVQRTVRGAGRCASPTTTSCELVL